LGQELGQAEFAQELGQGPYTQNRDMTGSVVVRKLTSATVGVDLIHLAL
jgi:hypothetical protein